jgi:hypothetical protein
MAKYAITVPTGTKEEYIDYRKVLHIQNMGWTAEELQISRFLPSAHMNWMQNFAKPYTNGSD